MIVNQVGGDINPAEPVCEWRETHLQVLPCLKKSIYSSSIYFLSSDLIQKLIRHDSNIVK